jgi:hypothetical protein
MRVCFQIEHLQVAVDLKNPAHYSGRELDNSTPTLTGILMTRKIRYGIIGGGRVALMGAQTIAAKNYVQQTS